MFCNLEKRICNINFGIYLFLCSNILVNWCSTVESSIIVLMHKFSIGLSLLLLVRKIWPKFLENMIIQLWYCILGYSLCVVPSAGLLIDVNVFWMCVLIINVIVLFLIVSPLGFCMIFCIANSIGLLFGYCISSETFQSFMRLERIFIYSTYIGNMVLGIITVHFSASSITSESSIAKHIVKNFVESMNKLFLITQSIKFSKLPQNLKRLISNIRLSAMESYYLCNIISGNILSTKNSKSINTKCDMFKCCFDAMERYSFTKNEIDLINFDQDSENFEFYGNEILVHHAFFNIIKNALYVINKSGKGSIFVKIYTEFDHGILYIKDTSIGISPKDIVNVFDVSFSKSTNGNGIGFSFCKNAIESMGGEIECRTLVGQYTEFFIRFQLINENDFSF